MGPDIGIIIRILPTELIRSMDKIIRTVDDRLTDDQINSQTETIEYWKFQQPKWNSAK